LRKKIEQTKPINFRHKLTLFTKKKKKKILRKKLINKCSIKFKTSDALQYGDGHWSDREVTVWLQDAI
jgi:hypothetical protein